VTVAAALQPALAPDLRRRPGPPARAVAGPQRAAPDRAFTAPLRPSAVPARLVTQVLREPGEPLDIPLKEEMENRLDAEFSDVRVHTDGAARASAAAVGASAYTSGSHVVIGDGGADKHTLAHELIHVIQQRTGSARIHNAGVHVSDSADPFERAAESDAARAMSGSAPRSRTAGADRAAHAAPAHVRLLQRKIATSGNDVFDEHKPLPLDQARSPIVAQLMSDPATFYLPDNPPADLSSLTVLALEQKKYLLGEKHGDGSWQKRTDRWSYISKMREGVRWFRPEPGEERRSIDKAAANPVIDFAGFLPLEDINLGFLTEIMSTQQLLGDFDSLVPDQSAMNVLNEQLAEIYTYLRQYRQITGIWLTDEYPSNALPPKGSRAWNFMEVGFVIENYKAELAPVLALKAGSVTSLTKSQAMALRPMLELLAGLLIELIDPRPRNTGLSRLWSSRRGPDPISNRAKLTALSAANSQGDFAPGVKESIKEGNVLREPRMIENIKAASAPLLVKLGDNHVQSVSAALGSSAVPVREGQDFEAMVKWSGPALAVTAQQVREQIEKGDKRALELLFHSRMIQLGNWEEGAWVLMQDYLAGVPIKPIT
jgi:Domain of unknown function (DUF4157)